MGALLNLVERNLHEVQVDADRMLFHIPSSSLFTADAVTGGMSMPGARHGGGHATAAPLRPAKRRRGERPLLAFGRVQAPPRGQAGHLPGNTGDGGAGAR